MASNTTWKAVSTLEWKKKQKKPALASKGVGAILGEAADVVVGKYANSSGPNSSPYLNRLSEIQIQDEAYIHQQLVKPEEVKPKRPPHRIFLGKGSRSSRGLKLSTSRKVRFDEGGEGSPTHKTAAAAGATAGVGAGIAVVAKGASHAPAAAVAAAAGATASPERRARFAGSSSSDGGASPPAAAAAGAGRAAKARRRAGGVSFEPVPSSSTAGSSTPDGASAGPSNTIVQQQGPDATHTAQAVATQAGSTSSSIAGTTSQGLPAISPAATAAVQAAKQSLPLSAQRSPSPLQQRPQALLIQQQQQQQHAQRGGMKLQHTTGGNSGSSASSAHHAGVGDNALMTRFLQQQPYGLGSPGSSGSNSSSLQLDGLQASRQGSVSALERRTARRSTDLVDKQLQWLRDGADSPITSSTSSSSSCPAAAAAPAAVSGSFGGPLAEFAATMGYRPTAIPKELFDRWSNIGGPKPPPAAAAPTATPAASRPATAGGNAHSGTVSSNGGASNSTKPNAARRHSISCVVPASSDGQQGLGVGVTLGSTANSSRPSSGHEAVAARLPQRRVSATNVLEGRVPLEYPKHGLSAGLRTSSADMSTLHALVASVKPPASSSSSSSGGPARTNSVVPHSSLSSGRSLPSSGRASPAHDPASPRSHPGANGSSNGQQQPSRRSSCSFEQSHGDGSNALTANATTGRGARAAAALAAAAVSAGSLSGGSSSGSPSRRASRATGSTSSSHGDEGDRWELHAGRRSPLQGGMLSTGTAGMHGVGGSHIGSAGGAGSTQAGLAPAAAAGSLGIRYGSSTGSSTSGSKAHLPDIGAKGAAGQQRH